MTIIDVSLLDESQNRYLTYALSVVTSRALPDVRDGLKPVQRRILYAMNSSLHLSPDKPHRKSAAVVGEVLARFHPHGDSACYEAMVRMAQDFSLRYPLVDGQGNFGSLDGDSAAAYRYTEARLTEIAIEVIGDIGQETVSERDNFDQTVKEPVVLPSRVPNLLMNGASGIAVGMATAIPPHNLNELVKGILLVLDDEEVSYGKLLGVIKGPDFPTGCQVVNSKDELKEIYSSGRGAIRMRGAYFVEKGGRGKEFLVVTSIPYTVDKSQLVEKIADLIIQRKLPQLVDIRDESTHEVRIVMEFAAGVKSGAAAEKVAGYLYKNTPLQTSFHVNLTALVPSQNPLVAAPAQLSLREMLVHFAQFRVEVIRCRLVYEKDKLEKRIHLLQGLASVLSVIHEVIDIVQKSKGRIDAAEQLQKRFTLSEEQALYIVDLRIYQLSRTSIDEITTELNEKAARVAAINRILKSKEALKDEVRTDLKRIVAEFGDERRCPIISEVEEHQVNEEEFVEHEDVFAIVTADGWVKRIRQTNDPKTTRIREGDSLLFVGAASTTDSLAMFTTLGNVFVTRVFDLNPTSGFGEPVQKMFRFQDGEQVVSCLILGKDFSAKAPALFLFTAGGLGARLPTTLLGDTKKTGKRLMKVSATDALRGAVVVNAPNVALVTEQGYGLLFPVEEIPLLSGAGKGVILQKLSKGDSVVVGASVGTAGKLRLRLKNGERELSVGDFESSKRALKGAKVVTRGAPVLGVEVE